jgi:hypothetical protein
MKEECRTPGKANATRNDHADGCVRQFVPLFFVLAVRQDRAQRLTDGTQDVTSPGTPILAATAMP